MFTRVIKAGLIAAVAGIAMQALATAPAEAFTLGAASPAPMVAGADVDHVWWHHWHRGHWGGGWHRHWHCWWGPYGRRCGW